MSGYPFQTTDHDASISVRPDKTTEGVIIIEVAAGSCVTVELPLDVDQAKGFLLELHKAIEDVSL